MSDIFPIVSEGAGSVLTFLGLWAGASVVVAVPFCRWLKNLEEGGSRELHDEVE